jgi:glycosyltransferase involved in cell wall biosynthesis
MHVGFVTPEFLRNGALYPGGLASYTYNIAKALLKEGHQVKIIFLGERNASYLYHDIPVIECKNFPHRLRSVLKLLFFKQIDAFIDRLFGSLSINFFLWKHKNHENIDILHYTNWKAVGAFRVSGASTIRISSFEPLWDNNPQKKTLDKRLCRWLEAYALRKFDHIFGPGKYLNQIIEKQLALSKPIDLLPTPAPDWTNQYSYAAENQKKLVAYVGTISYIKGGALLLDLIRQYISSYTDTTFVCAGKAGAIGAFHASDKLAEMTSSFPDNFTYFAHLNRAELHQLYSEANLVIIPSLIDNFPNTALEAMQSGTPVLASHSASLDSLIQDNESGYIMRNRDAGSWIKRIRMILYETSPECEISMQQKIKDSLFIHKPKIAVGRLLDYYQQVLDDYAQK